MALGENNYSKNGNNNNYHPSVYGYQFSNPDAKLDKTALTFTWWNKLLKLSIAPKLNNDGDYAQYDHKNAISVYLGVQSARALQILIHDFVQFLNDPANADKDYNRSIPLKSGNVILSNGKFIKQEGCPCMVITKMNDQGKIESSFSYEFKVGTMFSVENFNPEDGSYETRDDQFRLIELELVEEALDQYVKAVSNMFAASVVHEMQPVRNAQRAIADKLGVNLSSGYKNNNSTRSSYFNNQKGSSDSNQATSSTLDELGNM